MFYYPYMVPNLYRVDNVNSFVRVLHASPDAPAVDIYANDNLIMQNFAFGEYSKYLSVPAGNYNIKVYKAGTKDNPVIDTSINIAPQSRLTVAAVGNLNDIRVFPIMESFNTPTMMGSCVRFVHLSPNAPAVDITLQDGTKLFSDVQFEEATNYINLPAAAYNLQVRPAGTNQAVLTIPNLQLAPNYCYTIYAIGTVGSEPKLKTLVITDGMNGGAKRDFYKESNSDFDSMTRSEERAPQDVNRVIIDLERRFGNIYRELQSAGIDRRLVRFLVRKIVEYVDRNFNKYTGTVERKTNALIRDLRRDNPCIFEIMNVFGINPNRVNNIMRTIIAFAFDNLRRKPVPRY